MGLAYRARTPRRVGSVGSAAATAAGDSELIAITRVEWERKVWEEGSGSGVKKEEREKEQQHEQDQPNRPYL